MERAEKVGLGVAGLGHILLFAALSLGLLTTSKPKPMIVDSLDVTLTDEIGLVSTATERTIEPPAQSVAPDPGPPEESAPPAPAAPEPTPAPPEPAPPEPAPPPPKPAPTPKPAPKPAPAKPAPPKKEAKPTPAKPSSAKPAPAKPAAKPAAKQGEGAGEGSKPKPTGSRLGKDFLKGIADSPSQSKSTKPRAAAVGAAQMAGLARLLYEKVKPCYNPPAGGADSGTITTVLDLKLNRDGTVAVALIGDQTGVTSQNQAYARQMADAARRAVLRCAPFDLPANLYEGGWDDFAFRFRP